MFPKQNLIACACVGVLSILLPSIVFGQQTQQRPEMIPLDQSEPGNQGQIIHATGQGNTSLPPRVSSQPIRQSQQAIPQRQQAIPQGQRAVPQGQQSTPQGSSRRQAGNYPPAQASTNQPDYLIQDRQVNPANFESPASPLRQSGEHSNSSIPISNQTNPVGEPNDLRGLEEVDLSHLNELSKPGSGKKIDLGHTIQKIGLSTLGVLAACVVFLVGMKKFGVTGQSFQSENRNESAIQETISLGSRCQIQVVKIDKHKVVVARDANGIKSVTHLPPTFEDELARSSHRDR